MRRLAVGAVLLATVICPAAASAGIVNLTMSVTAPPTQNVNVGEVTSSPAGIDCDYGSCSSHFDGSVTLTYTPPAGGDWEFVEWLGPCEEARDAPSCTFFVSSGDETYDVTAKIRDVRPPVVTLEGLSDSTYYRGTITGIQVSASDAQNFGYVTNVSLLAKGVEVASSPSSPATFELVTPAGEGRLSVEARATDGAGNVGSYYHMGVNYDNVGPALVVTSGPAEGEERTPGDVSFNFTASDPRGVAEVDCAIDGAAPGPCSAPFESGGGSHLIKSLADGPHTFQVRARDSLGNEAVVRRSFVIRTPPAPGGATPAGTAPGAAPGGGTGPAATIQGGGAVRPVIPALIRLLYTGFKKKGTRIDALTVRKLPAGARVEVRCTGRGCPFRAPRLKIVKGRAKAGRSILGRYLRPGQTLEVRATAPGFVGKVKRLVIGRSGKPKESLLCLPPNTLTPRPC